MLLSDGNTSYNCFLNKLFNILYINPYANTEFFRLSGDIKKDIGIIVYLIIFTPITEEMLFRGVALEILSQKSIEMGILVSSILFGLSHGNVIQMISSTFTGIIFASIAVKFGDVKKAMVCHAFVNINSIIWAYLELINIEKIQLLENAYYLFWFVVFIFFVIVIFDKTIFIKLKDKKIFVEIFFWNQV